MVNMVIYKMVLVHRKREEQAVNIQDGLFSHREKEMCIEHIFCMHSMGYVNNMWLQVESYIDFV